MCAPEKQYCCFEEYFVFMRKINQFFFTCTQHCLSERPAKASIEPSYARSVLAYRYCTPPYARLFLAYGYCTLKMHMLLLHVVLYIYSICRASRLSPWSWQDFSKSFFKSCHHSKKGESFRKVAGRFGKSCRRAPPPRAGRRDTARLKKMHL